MAGQTYQGMSIDTILQKVDLLNCLFDEDGNIEKQGDAGTSKNSPGKAFINASDPTSAYLGKLTTNVLKSLRIHILYTLTA